MVDKAMLHAERVVDRVYALALFPHKLTETTKLYRGQFHITESKSAPCSPAIP